MGWLDVISLILQCAILAAVLMIMAENDYF